jgi:hypothetical protein
MRTFLLVALAGLAGFELVSVALAGERIIGSGCQVSVLDGGIGSSASDTTNCVWNDGQWLSMQCDGGVYYSKDGTSPAAATHPTLTPGDPYPIAAQRDSTVNPVKVKPTVGATVTCKIFASDSL